MNKLYPKIWGLFPCPVYVIKRDFNLSNKEEKEIEEIIKDGVLRNVGNFQTINTDIFNGRLKKIKQFCEQHINEYVNQVIYPKKELEFYITQSWINVTKPGSYHHNHTHGNSIISGVFYISCEEEDNLIFEDPNHKIRNMISFDTKESNVWNSPNWKIHSRNNELILFPSWIHHQVTPNEKATKDRISISFNTFVKGTLGEEEQLNILTLK